MWDKELDIARGAARAAGGILLHLYGEVHHIVKKGEIDLVTEADLQAEEAILEIIRRHYPQDGILSEETGTHGQGSERIWLVDPLDGTINFAHGFPFFAVSIALEVRGQIVLGVVYNPYMKEDFAAVIGTGAFMNGTRIRVSEVKDLRESLLATGFPYDIHERPQRVLEHFTRMVTRAQGVRRPGSAALDLCYVALGRFDGFWEPDLHPWDTAAGLLIAQEAGAIVTTFEGAAYSPYLRSIVAANPHIHPEMIRVLRDPCPPLSPSSHQ